jgi:O-6-methylguanine DNA methyltransferase
MKSFREKVLQVVKSIPKGSVMTYGEVALRAGSKNASRAVGTILKQNQDTMIPCHRVVRANGKLGEYNGLQGKSKEEILIGEGLVVRDSKVHV